MILEQLETAYSKHKTALYKPCPLLTDYVNKGWTGKKAEKGFYKYK
jgi:3-hydroxyacyl-CoA dehydrogenase